MKLEIKNGIAEITLSRPTAANSLGLQEAKNLSAILNQLKKTMSIGKNPPTFRGILLRSDSPFFFCAGGNLDEQKKLKTKALTLLYHRQIRKCLTALDTFPLPVVAIVQGLCLGGGIELISCADYIIATPAALFGFWQRRIGLTFGWGGGTRLSKRMNLHQLRHSLLRSQNFSAPEALHLGLIDELVPSWAALSRAHTWIQEVTGNHLHATALVPSIKKWTSQSEIAIFENLIWKAAHLLTLKNRKPTNKLPLKSP